MKEFDIEKAKAGASVCTRDGRPVRIICFDYQEYGQQEEDEKFPIIALVKYDKGERAFTYRESGKCRIGKDDELMMAPVKHEGWVNIYGEKGLNSCGGFIFSSMERAKEDGEQCEEYITTIHIEWEE